jgi:hypothetical protein
MRRRQSEPPRLARFACDVTVPMGHPLCGGWITPARSVTDPLEARGLVILGAGRPIVIGAIDWCELRNGAYDRWRNILAVAAGTDPERVALSCVHQHDAPMADLDAQALLDQARDTTPCVDADFLVLAAERSARALKDSIASAEPFDRVGVGRAKVDRVASARRVLGPDGKILYTRTSATRDPKAIAKPEGVIDPWLRTIAFFRGDRPLAAIHHYATHPMSRYGQGEVSADFAGLARRAWQEKHEGTHTLYLTGCAGDITAGKYNDGSPPMREVLRDRMIAAMEASWADVEPMPVTAKDLSFRVRPVRLPPREEASFGAVESRKVMEDPSQSVARRNNAAMRLAWLARLDRPIDLTCLRIGRAALVHLPGEPFVAYQLRAQAMRPDLAVAIAGYGDGGPGYIPTAEVYAQGGYEPTVALVGPGSEAILTRALGDLLRD